MPKNILSLSSTDAKNFFLRKEAYCSIEFPPYFVFDEMLSSIAKLFTGELDFKWLKEAKKKETVNHFLYGNKDGKYAWRKYELINPLIYVSLVNVVTNEKNWKNLQDRFKKFKKNKNIECESIPAFPKRKSKQKAAQISQWATNIEKKSIALSLEYKFLYHTDITHCYGSIYTHSLSWAIHTKEEAKTNRGYDGLFGNKIDHHIQAMSCGQTNGIPQGSILMDFMAEILLGYADSELSKKLKVDLKGKKFHILRYVDDYRIFVTDVNDGDTILKCLSEVLLDLGFQLHANKTSFETDVISGSIKKDKLYALQFTDIPKKSSEDVPSSKLEKKLLLRRELFQQLLIVQQIGKKFPNSGTLRSRLSKILDIFKPDDFYKQEEIVTSLLIDIAYDSPNSFPLIACLISKCISKLPNKKKEELIKAIQKKICMLANIGLLEIWVQRMNLNFQLDLKEKLCRLVYGNTQKIFDTDWIKIEKIKKIINSNIFIDQKIIDETKNKITIGNEEVQIFFNYVC